MSVRPYVCLSGLEGIRFHRPLIKIEVWFLLCRFLLSSLFLLQKFRVCDWWYNVKCEDASEFFDLNLDVMLLEGLESGPRNVVGDFEESLGDLSAQLALLSDLDFSSMPDLDLTDLWSFNPKILQKNSNNGFFIKFILIKSKTFFE